MRNSILLIYGFGIHSLSFNIAIVFPNAHILSKLLQTRLHGLILVIRSRLSEVAQFQSCGFWLDFHTGLAFLVTVEQLYLRSLQHLIIVPLSKLVMALNLYVLSLEPIQLKVSGISTRNLVGKVASL